MSLLNLNIRLLQFDDVPATSDPRLKKVDYSRLIKEVSVGRPLTDTFSLQAGEARTIWNGTRTTDFDGTTELILSVSPLAPDRYRLAHTGTGTAPGFRVDRVFSPVGATFTFTVNANATVLVTSTGGSPAYGSVVVGDNVLIRGVATGDSSGPFDALNVGYWRVLATTALSLTMARLAGESFSGKTEAVVVAAATELVVLSSDRVQVGDTLELLGGFATAALRKFRILAVTPTSLDIQSSVPVAAETAIPGTGNLRVYTDAKRHVYVEADQGVVIRYNGDIGSTNEITPEVSPEGETILGLSLKTGTVWSLVIFNKSTVIANVYVIGIGTP